MSINWFNIIPLFLFFLYFYQLEANYFTILQWVLSYIDMNQPWIYMYLFLYSYWLQDIQQYFLFHFWCCVFVFVLIFFRMLELYRFITFFQTHTLFHCIFVFLFQKILLVSAHFCNFPPTLFEITSLIYSLLRNISYDFQGS